MIHSFMAYIRSGKQFRPTSSQIIKKQNKTKKTH